MSLLKLTTGITRNLLSFLLKLVKASLVRLTDDANGTVRYDEELSVDAGSFTEDLYLIGWRILKQNNYCKRECYWKLI